MSRERFTPSPKAEEFISLIPSSGMNDHIDERLSQLAVMPEVIDSLTPTYWLKNIQMLFVNPDRQRETEQDKAYQAARFLLDHYKGLIVPPVRKLMWDRYGFNEGEVIDLSDSAVLETYFDLFGFVAGSFSDEAFGTTFKRPIHRFSGKSRLDMIRDGKFEEVRQFELEGLSGGAT